MRKIPHYAVKHEYDEAPPHHSDSFNFHIAVVDSKNIRSAPYALTFPHGLRR